MNRLLPSVLMLALGVACSAASWNRLTGEAYELDAVSRAAPAPCRPELLRVYRGERVRLEPPITVAAPFERRVARFEVLVAEVGRRVYGRAPTRILNAGAYACRAVAHRNERLSEHALGNALDVIGFRFPVLDRDAPGGGAENVALELPRALERGFTITIARDYPHATARADAVSARHRLFFEALASGLRQADIFRGMLGPSDPHHATHLHLDMGPWSYERL